MFQYKLTTLTNMLSNAKTNNNNKRIKNVLTYITKKKTWKGKNAMFRCYLAQVFDQVVVQEHTKMNVFMFYHLVQWPLFPAEKMFKYFVSNDNGNDSGLSCNGFCDNVIKVYGAGVNELAEVLFDVLDFMNYGKICVEDVNIFFVHLHMVEQSAENEGMVYEIVKRFFNGKWELTKEEYMDIVVGKGNNDVVVLFYFYIARFCFYNTQAVEYYEREIYSSSQAQEQEQSMHVNTALLSSSTYVDDDVKISECVLDYIELVLTSSSSSLHEDEDDNANGTTIINDDNNNTALLQELSDINNSEDDLSDLNRFEVQMKECMEKINPNKKPLKIIKSCTSSFFPTSSSSTSSTTAKTDTSTASKATRSQFYNMFHHANTTTTTQSTRCNTNEFVFYMKETIFDTLDMLESSKRTVPISTNTNNTNNYNLTSTISNTTTSITNLNDNNNNKIEQINKKIQFVRIKVYVFKNHVFTSLYTKDQSNKKNNTNYQNMYYFSSLCTYIKLTKAKFTYFNQIKYAINISHLSNCAPVNTVFYAEDEITARTFIALFSSKNQCESLRYDINERFIIGEDIGKGKFGIVKQGKERSHYTSQHTNNNNNNNHRSKNVAIKIVGKDTNIIESVFEINEWEKYIFKFLTKVNHPNIINAIALYEDESFIYYVYQYISNGTLRITYHVHHIQ